MVRRSSTEPNWRWPGPRAKLLCHEELYLLWFGGHPAERSGCNPEVGVAGLWPSRPGDRGGTTEKPASRLFAPMAIGQRAPVLDATAQRLTAFWAAKTAFLLELAWGRCTRASARWKATLPAKAELGLDAYPQRAALANHGLAGQLRR